MKTMRAFISILLFVMTLPAAVAADDLLKVFKLASQYDPELLAARAGYKARVEAKPQARSALLPNISISGSTSENKLDSSGSSSDYTGDNLSLNLTQPIFNATLFLRYKQAGNTVKKASVDLSAAYQSLIIRTAERYFGVLAAIDQLEFAMAEQRAIARQLEQVNKRFKVGLTAITNVHEARAAHDLARAQVIEARNALATAREALRELTNRPSHQIMKLKAKLPLITPTPLDPKQWTETALRQNLALKSTLFDVHNAKMEIKVQNSGHLPTLDLVASKSKNKTSGGFFGARDTDTETVELRFKLPLFSGGYTSSKGREARQLYQQALQNMEKTRRSTLRQTRDAYRGVLSGISRVKALRQAIVSSKSALRATTTGYRVGTRNIVDVLNAQRELFKARSNFSIARNEYILNLLRLKQAAGTLSIKDLKIVNQWLEPVR